VLKTHFRVIFSETSPILNEFSTFFSELRDQSKLFNSFSKLVINSLYGRCGLKNTDQTSVILFKKEYDLIKKDLVILEERSVNGVYFLKIKPQKGTFNRMGFRYSVNPRKIDNNVAIASAITSKARIKLYGAFLDLNKVGGRLLYCDTDSIFIAFHTNRYRDFLNYQLGEVFFDSNKRDTIIVDSVFISSKSYALRYLDGTEVVKIKGFSTKGVTFSELKQKFYSTNKEVSKIKSFAIIKKSRLVLKVDNLSKTFLYDTYNKRIFSNTKSTTDPIYKKNQ